MNPIKDSPEIKEFINKLCVDFLTKPVADAIEEAVEAGEFEREIMFLDKLYQAKELIRLHKHYRKSVETVFQISLNSTVISTKLGIALNMANIVGPPPPDIMEQLPPEIQEVLKQFSELHQQPDNVEDITDCFSNESDKPKVRRFRPENN